MLIEKDLSGEGETPQNPLTDPANHQNNVSPNNKIEFNEKGIRFLRESDKSSDHFENPKSSYASILTGTKVLPKSYKIDLKTIPIIDIPVAPKQYEYIDGYPAVIFSDEEISQTEEVVQYSLVAKFYRGRPSIDYIRSEISTKWGLKSTPIIGVMDHRHILIKLADASDFAVAWSRNNHQMQGFMFKLFKWSWDFIIGQEPTFAPIWLNFPNLPINFCNQSYLSTIVSGIGKCIAIDLPTLTHTRPSGARVCVELDLLAEKPSMIWLGHKEKKYLQTIEYENCLEYCTYCHIQGHGENICFRKNKSGDKVKVKEVFEPFWRPTQKIDIEIGGATVAATIVEEVVHLGKESNVKGMQSADTNIMVENPILLTPGNEITSKLDEEKSSEIHTSKHSIAGSESNGTNLTPIDAEEWKTSKKKTKNKTANPTLKRNENNKVNIGAFEMQFENSESVPVNNSFSALVRESDNKFFQEQTMNAFAAPYVPKVASSSSPQYVIKNNTLGGLMNDLHLDSSYPVHDDDDNDSYDNDDDDDDGGDGGYNIHSDPDSALCVKRLKGKYKKLQPFCMTLRGHRVNVKF